MILIGDVHVMAGPDIVADLDCKMSNNPTAAPDQAAITDFHHRVGHTFLTRNHAGCQRNVGADHRSGTDLNVTLVHDRVRRKANHAALSKRAESTATLGVRADRRPQQRRLSAAVNQLTNSALDAAHQPYPCRVREVRIGQHVAHATCRLTTVGKVATTIQQQPTDPFQTGSLTNVDGVLVGHHQRSGRGWQTGTTAVIVPNGAVAAVDVRGGGPGTRETDALDARNLVDRIHAICLTGGSAYGLAAADGVMAYLEHRQLGVPVGPHPYEVVPVVPTAVIFDLGRGGSFANRPGPAFGERAARSACAGGVRRGAVGAGTGARAGGLQGGVGMASTTLKLGGTVITISAIAVVNASGSVIDPTSGLPWQSHGFLRKPTGDERRALAIATAPAVPPPLNTTIGIVATDANLSRPETGRLAQSAHDGLARAIRPAHSLMDGDTIFGLATTQRDLPATSNGILRDAMSRAALLNQLFAASADVFAAACTDAVLTARTIGVAPAYRDVCPSAFRALAT